MMTKPSYVYVTYIHATPEKIWNAITDREISRQYWHANVSDWKPGSRWEHQNRDGSNDVFIAGRVIESEPPRRLIISWANPSDIADPKKVSRVTFVIEPLQDGVARLTVTHEELEAGSDMEKGITRGWPIVLSSLKSWLETGKPVPFWLWPKGGR
jgi:uncharacterized protein YndB with AHSA1/START domain